ncbi:Gfo/Idh/MocA family protein [Beijerinckia indica]|uniref:Oxidoreductase domain protein n=1 Tax=Beijerinckia indica subsp. indica (strain ATCC 9039 / DSM 1715 / NCIMB 8712) TaxID=395963 RepID=B2IJW2_BEII9|nr:Gfo/Idh/MocA family oxidoreductase [Beijerinckia indica]ACB96337.1 oxidoreductase domain protein [Beijerinckia indica subsp. indica ATCC 9039]
MGLTGTQTYPRAARRLRLGIVGGGQGALVGQWHWAGARLSNRWDVIAGALSSDPERARASGREWMLAEDRVYADYREMAKAEAARPDGIEAVAICTPNWTHRPIAEAFMDAGIDIICDKPMAMTPEDCDALAAKQKESGVVFAVTHPYPYHPMARQAREMVVAGALGEIRQALVEYAQDWATEQEDQDSRSLAWRRDPAKVGRASATGDIGTHAFNLIEFVTGLHVSRLRADFHVCGAPKAMEDTAFMKLAFENGAPGALWITQAAPGNYCALRFRVYGTKAGLEWDQEYPEQLRFRPLNQPEQVIIRGHGAGVLPAAERMILLPRGHGESLSDAWGHLYIEIAIAVEARRTGQPVPEGLLALPGIAEGTRGVQFIHAAADSNEAGGTWQELP